MIGYRGAGGNTLWRWAPKITKNKRWDAMGRQLYGWVVVS